MSKITAILHHVDISLKEVNHVRTITNELGTHGLIVCVVSLPSCPSQPDDIIFPQYYDYLPQLVLGLLGVVTVLMMFAGSRMLYQPLFPL
jgi:hypothetical protein